MTSPEPGALLDKEDARRYKEFVHQPLDEIPLDKAKVEILGESAWRDLESGRSSLFQGAEIDTAESALPFLYFYPKLCIQLCPHCTQLQNTSLLEPLLRENAALITITESFQKTPRVFQHLAWKYSDAFVGPRSFELLRQTQIVQDLFSSSGDQGGTVPCANTADGAWKGELSIYCL